MFTITATATIARQTTVAAAIHIGNSLVSPSLSSKHASPFGINRMSLEIAMAPLSLLRTSACASHRSEQVLCLGFRDWSLGFRDLGAQARVEGTKFRPLGFRYKGVGRGSGIGVLGCT